MKALLTVKDLKVNYGAIAALKGLSLEVREGEIVTLIGANGAGKSTFLMSLFGQPRAVSGEILFAGEPIAQLPSHHVARRGIALVPEGRRVFAKMSVEENLLMGTVPTDGKAAPQTLRRVYELFPRLKERMTQRAGTMSGGEQQMLAIGRALMSHPKLLLLDEPSLGLAPIVIQGIFKALKEIAATGTTIFLVEQNARKALQLADRGYVLVNGEIKLEGKSADLVADPRVQELYLGH